MAYNKTIWHNNTKPAINEVNLNKIENQLALDSARIDEIITLPPGSTQGNEELVDIRVGADGTTYTNAGTAVRAQVGAIKEDIEQLYDVKNLLENATWNDGWYYTSGSGAKRNDSTTSTTDEIIIPNGVDKLKVSFPNTTTTQDFVFRTVDANGSAVFYQIYRRSSGAYEYEIPVGTAKTFSVGLKKQDKTLISVNVVCACAIENIRKDISDIENELANVLSKPYSVSLADIQTINGYYDRGFVTHADSNYVYTDYIEVNGLKSIEYALHSDMTNTYMIALFDESKNFIEAINATTQYVNLSVGTREFASGNNVRYIRLCYAGQKYSDNTITIIGTKQIAFKEDVEAIANNNKAELSTMIHDGDYLLGKIFDKSIHFGDSLTSGDYGADPFGSRINNHEAGYPYFFAKELGVQGFNRGQSGYTTVQIWGVVQATDFTQYENGNAVCVMLECGGNGGFTDTLATDVEPYADYHDYANTNTGCYCKIIEYIKEKMPKANLFCIAIPYMNKSGYSPTNANIMIKKIADRYSLPFLDIYNNGSVNADNLHDMCPIDNVHRGRYGYYVMARDIIKEMNRDIKEHASRYTSMD